MSETEFLGVLDSGTPITLAEIHELTAAVTPHFSLQVRNRLVRLIEPLAADDPTRIFGEQEIARLEALSKNSGQPRTAADPS